MSILEVMLEAPNAEWYGLELAGRASLKSGTIYPILARLERAGWLESAWEDINPSLEGRPRRRFYRLTGLGERSALAAIGESRARSGIAAANRLRPGTRPEGQPA